MTKAEGPNTTEIAFDKNWASATEAGEYLTQKYMGAWSLALDDIREAILGGCPAALEADQGGQKLYAPLPTDPTSSFWFPPDRLRWVNALNPTMRREAFADRPWPWEIRAFLSPNERLRDIDGRPLNINTPTTLPLLLRRAEAIQWGLLPALGSPQAAASGGSPPPDKAIGIQASARAQSAPEQSETQSPTEPRTETEPPPAPAPAAGDLAETGSEPAARAEESMPEPVPPSELELAPATESPRAESVLPPPPEPGPAADVGDQAGAANLPQPQPQQPTNEREPNSGDARASRRRKDLDSGPRSGAQTRRARAVLKRLYGDPSKYPTEEEASTPDLLKRFTQEYEKVEGKAKPPSTLGIPSRATILREVGRQED